MIIVWILAGMAGLLLALLLAAVIRTLAIPGKKSTYVPDPDPARAEAYAEKLAARYRDAGIIWVLGGDRRPVKARDQRVVAAFAEGLRAGDGGAHGTVREVAVVRAGSRRAVDGRTRGCGARWTVARRAAVRAAMSPPMLWPSRNTRSGSKSPKGLERM